MLKSYIFKKTLNFGIMHLLFLFDILFFLYGMTLLY